MGIRIEALTAKGVLGSAALCLWISSGLVAPAAAQNYVWQFNSLKAQGGPDSVSLRYAVPETDNVAFDATCTAGKNPRSATVKFGYRIGDRTDGTNVTLSAQSRRYAADIPAVVIGAKGETGISGVSANINFNSRFWHELENGRRFSYNIGDGPTAELSLRGSGRQVRRFLNACQAMADAPPPAGPNVATGPNVTAGPNPPPPAAPPGSPSVPPGQPSNQPPPPKNPAAGPPVAPATGGDRKAAIAAGQASCKKYEKAKSTGSKKTVTVTFTNKTGGMRSVMWVDGNGKPVDMARLDPGKSFTVKTYVSYLWMFTDGPGNCMEMMMPQEGQTVYDIKAPSPAFGPGND